MHSTNSEESGSVVTNSPSKDDNVLRVVVTDACTEIALALVYRIFRDNVFGENQLIFVSFYEPQGKASFLETAAIELAAFSPNLLKGVDYTYDPSTAFEAADVVFCIGKARGYEFTEEEYTDTFFEECILLAKAHGEAIERYAKKSVKVIVIGMTFATIISRHTQSVSTKNITALSIFNLKMTAAHIASRVNCRPDEIKNIITWGANNRYTYPDCTHLSFRNTKAVTDDDKVWLRKSLPRIIQSITNRSWYTRSLAYALADHCKLLWNGTPQGEWTCMGVLSDKSYGVCSEIFFSYPVTCKDKQYKIVQGLADSEYVRKYIESLSKAVSREIHAALKICDLK